MKKLLQTLVHKGVKKCKLSSYDIDVISQRLQACSQCVPIELARKPRPVQLFEYWKGTEFRSFLFYFGPVGYQKVLPERLYQHFLILHIATYVLASEIGSCDSWGRYASDLLHCFVKEIHRLYCDKLLSYNFHNLLHLSNHVPNFSKLDHFFTFVFKNCMKKIKCWCKVRIVRFTK